MEIKFEPGFWKKMKRQIEGYDMEVGILEDADHYDPAPQKDGVIAPAGGLKVFAGGPARKIGSKKSKDSMAEILTMNMFRLNENILLAPFLKKGSEIIKFSNEFLKMAIAKKEPSRVRNLLQAIVRNPILRKEYGSNSPSTAKTKGFDRPLIDTGQLFDAIKAKVRRNV